MSFQLHDAKYLIHNILSMPYTHKYVYILYIFCIYIYMNILSYICIYITTYTYHTFVYTYCMCMYLPMIYSKTQRYFSPWSAPFPTILTLQLRSQFCGSAPASMMEATWFPSYLMLSNGDFFVDQGWGRGFANLRPELCSEICFGYFEMV